MMAPADLFNGQDMAIKKLYDDNDALRRSLSAKDARIAQRVQERKKMTFEGTFNYHGEVTKLWTTTTSRSRARSNMLARLAKKYNVAYPSLASYFNGTDRYSIVEVPPK